MADIKISMRKTLGHEGKYKKDNDDAGDWTGGVIGHGLLVGTNWGISAPQYSSYLKRPATEAEMRNMTLATAEMIYTVDFWRPMRGSELNVQREADDIFDMGVNSGIKTGIKLAQRAASQEETGHMDDVTLNYLNNK